MIIFDEQITFDIIANAYMNEPLNLYFLRNSPKINFPFLTLTDYITIKPAGLAQIVNGLLFIQLTQD